MRVRGAGAQAVTLTPLVLVGQSPTTMSPAARSLAMTAGWAANALVAQWVFRREPSTVVRVAS